MVRIGPRNEEVVDVGEHCPMTQTSESVSEVGVSGPLRAIKDLRLVEESRMPWNELEEASRDEFSDESSVDVFGVQVESLRGSVHDDMVYFDAVIHVP